MTTKAKTWAIAFVMYPTGLVSKVIGPFYDRDHAILKCGHLNEESGIPPLTYPRWEWGREEDFPNETQNLPNG